MQRKRLFIISFVGIFIVLLLRFGWIVFQPDPAPLGSQLPKLKVFNGADTLLVAGDGKEVIMVMLFHENCPICSHQLKKLKKLWEKFAHCRLYCITTDTDFVNQPPEKWRGLIWKNVVWGTVNESHWRAHYGRIVTPTLYIYDHHSALVRKYVGELEIENVIVVCDSLAEQISVARISLGGDRSLHDE